MNLKPHNKIQNQGFTLLEVIIALVILSFISIGIYQTTWQTFKLRDSLLNEGDFYNGIRMAMDLVARDISLVYDPKMALPPAKKKNKPAGTPPPPEGFQDPQGADPSAMPPKVAAVFNEAGVMTESKFWGPTLDKTGLRPSRFQGTDKGMSFISTSHLRIYKDSQESELAKIEFQIDTDPQDKSGSKEAKLILFKTESPDVYQDNDRKDARTIRLPLLKGLRSAAFEYYRKDKDAWSKVWDSNSPDLKGLYPDRVKITIEVEGPTPDLKFSGQYFFKPEVPIRGIDPST